ncbi:thiopurine S-methyltransferase-like isoform X2 [Dreissena polymorpha]|uniref:thiopurine S-methyltransferase-like isoform X2 n=1 Tax=Dreissena polymorpha TaxID=45954 RepID=UPI002265662E|nr:thiopurine S-methyltransferase-like isoform X2 [Dreissena polymorpha]
MMFEGGAKSVFAPLCGKSLDLIWMYNRGHTVVGAEIAEQAVQELFSEKKLDVHVQHVEGVGPLYKVPRPAFVITEEGWAVLPHDH